MGDHLPGGVCLIDRPFRSASQLRKALVDICLVIAAEYGGPIQFMNQLLPTDTKKRGWATVLRAALPPRHDCMYMHASRSQEWPLSTEVSVTVADLSFQPSASPKPMPGKRVLSRLMDEMVVRSVLTAGDPLKVYLATNAAKEGDAFTLYYVKGMGRAATIHCMCYLLLMEGGNVSAVWKQKLPDLYASLCRIMVSCDALRPDLQEVAFKTVAGEQCYPQNNARGLRPPP